jgi:rfaE bifunctional protein nucleotidyltransferase chain/domain
MAGPLGVSGGAAPGSLRHVVAAGRALAARWQAANVVVTIGDRGAVLVTSGGPPLVVPAVPVPHGDPCGAGDRFAATAAGLLGDGALPSEAVEGAVAAASAFVAAGGADGRPEPPRGPTVYGEGDALSQLLARVRGGGGTVVATGGCFDLLHAGHVGLLDGARALGDCLVVCLNSDASVRRLKGPGRPLVPAAERSVVLGAMTAVDAVVTFEEDTPEALLDRLRPDVFVKGADYAVADLPEAPLLARWGGQAVVLPYAPGWSTTRLLKEASRAH